MKLLNVREMAFYLDLTEKALRMRMYRRQIPYLKVGGSIRFDLGDIKQWLASNSVVPAVKLQGIDDIDVAEAFNLSSLKTEDKMNTVLSEQGCLKSGLKLG